MKVIVFDQWDKLVEKFKGIATAAMNEKSQYAVNRVQPKGGRAHLLDRAANVLTIAGGTTTVVMPDIEPGKARDFMLRVTATGENVLKFEGAEAFEGEEDALDSPGDGETAVYFFTETAGDILLVGRRIARRIETA